MAGEFILIFGEIQAFSQVSLEAVCIKVYLFLHWNSISDELIVLSYYHKLSGLKTTPSVVNTKATLGTHVSKGLVLCINYKFKQGTLQFYPNLGAKKSLEHAQA